LLAATMNGEDGGPAEQRDAPPGTNDRCLFRLTVRLLTGVVVSILI
jgi:hypothetical protein